MFPLDIPKLCVRAIREKEAVIAVKDGDHFFHAFHCFFVFPESSLNSLALGDVANHCNNELSPLQSDELSTDLDGKRRSVLPEMDTFLDKSSRFLQLRDGPDALVMIHSWINVAKIERQNFFASVAKIGAALLIHVENLKGVRINHLNAVVGLVNQRSE